MIMSKQGKQMKLKYFDFEVKDSVRTSVPKQWKVKPTTISKLCHLFS